MLWGDPAGSSRCMGLTSAGIPPAPNGRRIPEGSAQALIWATDHIGVDRRRWIHVHERPNASVSAAYTITNTQVRVIS